MAVSQVGNGAYLVTGAAARILEDQQDGNGGGGGEAPVRTVVVEKENNAFKVLNQVLMAVDERKVNPARKFIRNVAGGTVVGVVAGGIAEVVSRATFAKDLPRNVAAFGIGFAALLGAGSGLIDFLTPRSGFADGRVSLNELKEARKMLKKGDFEVKNLNDNMALDALNYMIGHFNKFSKNVNEAFGQKLLSYQDLVREASKSELSSRRGSDDDSDED